jgi:hypothetical protein
LSKFTGSDWQFLLETANGILDEIEALEAPPDDSLELAVDLFEKNFKAFEVAHASIPKDQLTWSELKARRQKATDGSSSEIPRQGSGLARLQRDRQIHQPGGLRDGEARTRRSLTMVPRAVPQRISRQNRF